MSPTATVSVFKWPAGQLGPPATPDLTPGVKCMENDPHISTELLYKKIALSTTVKRYKLIFGQTGFCLQPAFGLLIITLYSLTLFVPSLKLEDVSHVRRAGILVEKPR